jgi:hypothetical protein
VYGERTARVASGQATGERTDSGRADSARAERTDNRTDSLHGEPGQEVTGEDEKRQERRGASAADKGDKARQGPTKQDKQVVCMRKGKEKKGERKVDDGSLCITISVTPVNDIRS